MHKISCLFNSKDALIINCKGGSCNIFSAFHTNDSETASGKTIRLFKLEAEVPKQLYSEFQILLFDLGTKTDIVELIRYLSAN